MERFAPTESGGQRRIEGTFKVTGDMPYAADLRIPGTQYVAVLRSPLPHARIVFIDTIEAQKAPGVALVLTGADVAHIRTSPLNVKSIGEMGNVPAAPAIANAVSDALGVFMDSLPLSAEKVLAAAGAK